MTSSGKCENYNVLFLRGVCVCVSVCDVCVHVCVYACVYECVYKGRDPLMTIIEYTENESLG